MWLHAETRTTINRMYVPPKSWGWIERKYPTLRVTGDWEVVIGNTTYKVDNVTWDLPLDPRDSSVTESLRHELAEARQIAFEKAVERGEEPPPIPSGLPTTYVESTEQDKMTFGEYARICLNGSNPKKPTIDPATTLRRGQVGSAYQESVRADLQVMDANAEWTATGLPPGLTIAIRDERRGCGARRNSRRDPATMWSRITLKTQYGKTAIERLPLEIKPGLPPDVTVCRSTASLGRRSLPGRPHCRRLRLCDSGLDGIRLARGPRIRPDDGCDRGDTAGRFGWAAQRHGPGEERSRRRCRGDDSDHHP